jgi:hypothetical protein
VTLEAYNVSTSQVITVNYTTNSSGQGQFSLPAGSYVFNFKAPGYLAKTYGSMSNPYTVSSGQSSFNLSYPPLIGGDFYSDGVVNSVDYTSGYLEYYGSYNEPTDIDASGEVNSLDFGVMESNWLLTSESY